MKQISIWILFVNFLSFAAFSAEEGPLNFRGLLCGRTLNLAPRGPVSIQIKDGKPIYNVGGDPRAFTKGVSDSDLRAFGIEQRRDDLKVLLATEGGRSLMSAEPISNLLQRRSWAFLADPYQNDTLMLYTDRIWYSYKHTQMGNYFKIYFNKQNPDSLFGEVFIAFKTNGGLEIAVDSLNRRLKGRTHNLKVIIDPHGLSLIVTAIELSSKQRTNEISDIEEITSGREIYMYLFYNYHDDDGHRDDSRGGTTY